MFARIHNLNSAPWHLNQFPRLGRQLLARWRSGASGHLRRGVLLAGALAAGGAFGVAIAGEPPIPDRVGVIMFGGWLGCVFLTAAFRVPELLHQARRAATLELELDRRDRLWASAAHDVKSHVSAMGLRAQILRDRLAAVPEPARGSATAGLEEIYAGARRVSRIIRDLEDIAQLDAGAPLSLHRERLDLRDLVESVAGDIRATANLQREIVVKADAAPLTGDWDYMRLSRVFGNLLDNAIKYSPDHAPVTVEISRSSDVQGAWACVHVDDVGVGIPVDDLQRIFEPFHRGANVAGRIAGTGLGLSGARDLVSQHGGRIEVDSQLGRGTRFTVWLPLVEDSETAAVPYDRPRRMAVRS